MRYFYALCASLGVITFIGSIVSGLAFLYYDCSTYSEEEKTRKWGKRLGWSIVLLTAALTIMTFLRVSHLVGGVNG